MSRLQLVLNVDNAEESIAFYRRPFNLEPAKVKPRLCPHRRRQAAR